MTQAEREPAPSDRGFDVFSSMLQERAIFLNGPIDDRVSATVCAQLLFLEAKAADREIWLYINSPGGVVTSGFAIYDTMQFIASPVATVCMGMAGSMASILLMAGRRGMRFALPNATILVHQPSGGFQGSAADLERHAADILKTKRRISELYVKHCGRTLEEVDRALDRDSFLSAEEARSWGLIDHVRASRAAMVAPRVA